jgi:hypothetical protein
MAAKGSIKESEVAAIKSKDYDIRIFFDRRVIVFPEFVPQAQNSQPRILHLHT